MKANREITGNIFNIQKYSVNDGPGIRTVVFLKGCPLRCKWCSNPESQSPKSQVLWDAKKCIRCGTCKNNCASGAVLCSEKRVFIDHTKCIGCGACIHNCPGMALKMEGERKSVEDVLRIVLQDMPFYEESGGGITLSGGEFLMQADFSRELLLASKEEGLHTCCETTGFATEEIFSQVIESLDMILMDLKHWNASKHKEGTGVGNNRILSNMKIAADSGKEILPRIPVIPDFNSSLEDARQFSLLLHELNISRCQLLPFHQFGENKYDLLNSKYVYQGVPALHREDLEAYRQVFIDHRIDAFF